MENSEPSIDQIRALLEQLGVRRVDFFIGKLQDNSSNRPVYEDFLVEGEAAATLAEYGFTVTMADRPDLKIQFADASFSAEAKHFRWKEKDQTDEENMKDAMAKGLLAQIGGIVEDGKQAWKQILEVAHRKAEQYCDSEPFVLIVRSSSPYNIGEIEVVTARNEINDRVSSGQDQVFRKLNGFLFFDRDFNISRKRSAYFYPTQYPNVRLDSRTLEALSSICRQHKFF